MHIDKAIRRLSGYIKCRKPDPDDCFHEAVQLGIEALKRILKGRNPDRTYVCYRLPGEPPEGDAT